MQESKIQRKKDEILSQINEFIIKICQNEFLRLFEELKEDLILKIESDLSLALKKIKEVDLIIFSKFMEIGQ